jgi:hypothetical protein
MGLGVLIRREQLATPLICPFCQWQDWARIGQDRVFATHGEEAALITWTMLPALIVRRGLVRMSLSVVPLGSPFAGRADVICLLRALRLVALFGPDRPD